MRFHHIGIASDFQNKVPALAKLLESKLTNFFTDHAQGVKGCFLSIPGSDGFLEFLEELPDSKVLDPWKSRGAFIYHIAFEVENLEKAIERAKLFGSYTVSPPTLAVAFPGRSVAFIFIDGVLVEFIGN